MVNLLLMLLISVATLGWSYLCFFKPETVKWNFTNPWNGNYYREANTFHAFLCAFMGLICSGVFVFKLIHYLNS